MYIGCVWIVIDEVVEGIVVGKGLCIVGTIDEVVEESPSTVFCGVVNGLRDVTGICCT